VRECTRAVTMVSLLRSSFRGSTPPLAPSTPPSSSTSSTSLAGPVRALAASLHSLGPRGGLESAAGADMLPTRGSPVTPLAAAATPVPAAKLAGGVAATEATVVGRRPPSPPRAFHSLIARNGMRLLITRAPTAAELPTYPTALAAAGVTDLVVVTELTFPTAPFVAAGITVTDLPWENGLPPPPSVVAAWMALIDRADGVVACACMAGLGRAPTLVAAALVERGVSVAEAVGVVRARRRGAINGVQMGWLFAYVPGTAAAAGAKAAAASKRGAAKAERGGFARRGSSSGLLRLRRWSNEGVGG